RRFISSEFLQGERILCDRTKIPGVSHNRIPYDAAEDRYTVVINTDEPIRLLVRQRTQQNAGHDAEYRGIGTNAQCQAQNHCQGKSRSFHQTAKGVTDISDAVLEHLHAELLP